MIIKGKKMKPVVTGITAAVVLIGLYFLLDQNQESIELK